MNWKDRLERARKKGKFTAIDINNSGYFKTCAIGEKFNLQNKNHKDLLTNLQLFGVKIKNKVKRRLGMDFYRAVKINDVETAQRVYDKIQKLKS